MKYLATIKKGGCLADFLGPEGWPFGSRTLHGALKGGKEKVGAITY